MIRTLEKAMSEYNHDFAQAMAEAEEAEWREAVQSFRQAAALKIRRTSESTFMYPPIAASIRHQQTQGLSP